MRRPREKTNRPRSFTTNAGGYDERAAQEEQGLSSVSANEECENHRVKRCTGNIVSWTPSAKLRVMNVSCRRSRRNVSLVIVARLGGVGRRDLSGERSRRRSGWCRSIRSLRRTPCGGRGLFPVLRERGVLGSCPRCVGERYNLRRQQHAVAVRGTLCKECPTTRGSVRSSNSRMYPEIRWGRPCGPRLGEEDFSEACASSWRWRSFRASAFRDRGW